MNISRHFAALVAILVAGCVVTGVCGFYGLTRMGRALDTVVSLDMKRFSKVTDARKLMRSFLVSEQSYILESSPERRAALEKDLTKAKGDFRATFDEYSALALAGDRDKLPQLDAAYKAWAADDVQVLALAREGRSAEAYALSSRKKTAPTWEEVIKDLIAADQKVLTDNTAATFQVYDYSRTLIVLAALAAIGIGLGAGVLIYRAISRSVREMVRLKDELAQANAGLERRIDERTRDIRTILDHVSFGLFICGPDLRIQGGSSLAAGHILGAGAAGLEGQSLLEVLRLTGRDADNFAAIYGQIFDPDFLLGALGIDQIPSRFSLAASVVGLTGSVIEGDDGRPARVLFCVADIGKLVEAEDEIARNRALLKMLASRDSFQQLVADVRGGLARVRAGGFATDAAQAAARRELHTLKGNLGVFGLSQVAAAVHALEDEARITADGVGGIEAGFEAFLRENRALLGEAGAGAELTVPARLVERTERAAQAGSATDLRRLFVDFFRAIRQKPVRALVGPIEDAFGLLAGRLGKDVSLTLEGGDTMVPQNAQDVFKNLTHLLRNAIDHGIEPAGQRGAKAATGRVTVAVSETDTALLLRVEDDGYGLDGELLKRKAVEKRLISAEAAARMGEAEAFELIFLAGFSTAATVSDVSGRGVGMSAVKAAVDAAAGTMRISSRRGGGTVFAIEIPKESAAGLVAAA